MLKTDQRRDKDREMHNLLQIIEQVSEVTDLNTKLSSD